MIDWPLAAGNVFMAAALTGLTFAPVYGAARSSRVNHRPLVIGGGLGFVASIVLLAFSWRWIPGGITSAASGHAALAVALVALAQIGLVARIVLGDELLAGMAGLLLSLALTIGPFALGPLAGDLSSHASRWILFVNPLVTVSSAAGIDFLHLDLIYRISPLAHRGVALPAWTAACGAYATFGLACYGVSRLRRGSA